MADIDAARAAPDAPALPRGGRVLEAPPPTGTPLAATPDIFRVVAPNPGTMTYHGTNTWFVPDDTGGLAVIDPGPDDAAHLAATLDAGAGRITYVLVSHSHGDHIGNAGALAAALGLPVHGHPRLADHLAGPLVPLADGDRIAGLDVVHTPGHAAEHLCFARACDRILFTADHVMGWSTSVVPPPPHGSARDYLRSLQKLLERDDGLYLSGHGPPVTAPHALVRTLLAQRLRRERELRTVLAAGPTDAASLTRRIYPALKPGLDFAARANIEGLLAKLAEDGKAAKDAGDVWQATPPPGHG